MWHDGSDSVPTQLLTLALCHGESLDIGSGPGPVHHFHDADRWRHPFVSE